MQGKIIAWGVAALVLTGPAHSAQVTPPDQVVKQTSDTLVQDIRAHHAQYQKNVQSLYDEVNKVVLPHFDWHYISQLVLARYWRKATPEQREHFQAAFQRMLVRSYSEELLTYYNVGVQWKPVHMASDATEATVHSEVQRTGKPTVNIDFSMRLKDGHWKVYDIVVDGLSLVTNFRSQVAEQIRRDGIDAVVKRFENGATLSSPHTTGTPGTDGGSAAAP